MTVLSYNRQAGSRGARMLRTALGPQIARAYILKWARSIGGKVLVVGNKSVVEEMNFPPHISMAWFNNVAGRDEWRDVRGVVILGRVQPQARDIEKMAAALTGRVVEHVNGRLPHRDAFRLCFGVQI